MDTHSITSFHNQGMSFTAHINGHKLTTDSNSEGAGEGPSPKRLMLASLAGCTGIDVVSILTKMKVPYSEFSIDVQASLTENQPQIYHAVKVTYKIKMDIVNRSKMEKAVKLSEEKYCGVWASLKDSIKIDYKIEIIE